MKHSCPRLCWPAWPLVLLGVPGLLLAEVDVSPFGSAGLEHSSNIFYFEDGDEAAALTGSRRRDDWVQRYVAGVDGGFAWSDNKLSATALARALEYEHFTHLDHDEYLFSTTLDWRATRVVDGKLHFQQERRLASFTERDSAQLTLETERQGMASAGVMVTPDWRVEGKLTATNLESPLPAFPEYELDEVAAGLLVDYFGLGQLAGGALVEYLEGEFRGVGGSGDFDQVRVEAKVRHEVETLTGIELRAGVTRREDRSTGQDPVNTGTGSLTYYRELSDKSRVDAELFRRIESYIGGPTPVVASGAKIGFDWRFTEKTALAAGYEWAREDFEGTFTTGPLQRDRKDTTQIAELRASYRALPWLDVQPYAALHDRNSNIADEGYDTSIVGIEFEIRPRGHRD